MPSTYGKRHDLPGYDTFRTGLSYRAVWEMLKDESEDSADWRYKSRGVILGMWHELKMQMYLQASNGGQHAPIAQ